MGTEQQRGVADALESADQVADVVPSHSHPRLTHPFAGQLVGASHRVGRKRSRYGARVLAAPRQVVTPLDDDPGQRHSRSVKVISWAPSHRTRCPIAASWSLPSYIG